MLIPRCTLGHSYELNARTDLKKEKHISRIFEFIYPSKNNCFIFFFCRWGRWDEILAHSGLRKGYSAQSIEDAFRLALLYCVNTYRGDEKLKSFTWELITPAGHHASDKSQEKSKAKKKSKKGQENGELEGFEWIANEKYDMEQHLEKNYRKHLDRHNNKILLRVKMMYYIQFDILGPYAQELRNPNRPLA